MTLSFVNPFWTSLTLTNRQSFGQAVFLDPREGDIGIWVEFNEVVVPEGVRQIGWLYLDGFIGGTGRFSIKEMNAIGTGIVTLLVPSELSQPLFFATRFYPSKAITSYRWATGKIVDI